jgi:hypothetical protein
VCFFAEPFAGTGLALDEESRTLSKALLLTAEGEAAMVALESEEVETVTPPASSSSELSSDEELDELESEDSGRGVFFACLRALASCFLAGSFSDSESEPESESESESLESLESELESEDEEDESDSDSDSDSSFLVVLAFLALGASLSESEPELESEDDSSLDSALRFTPADFLAAGAGVEAASSSSSSSASLSEEEEDDDEGEGERAFWSFTALGASSISTSESLESLSESELESALLSLSLSELELEESLFSQARKISSKDGAFFASVLPIVFFNSFSNAVLVVTKPLPDRKEEIDARSRGGAAVVLF